VSGRDAANAKRNQTRGLQGWEKCLRTVDCWPQRRFANAAEVAEFCQHEATLSVDGIEQRLPRPSENGAQKDPYSGKKSATPSKR
jgi:hypothetical protein